MVSLDVRHAHGSISAWIDVNERMIKTQQMAQVVPREAVEASPDAVDYCLYELKPSHALPTLDLSVSIKSRFLSRSSLNVVNRFVRSRQLVFALFLASVAFTIMVTLVPADVGVPLAVVSFILGVPSCLVGFVLLRSSVVAVLLKVGDVWLMSMLSAASFIILALMFRDARGLAFCTQLIGVQTNILIDANLRGVRRLAITTVIACLGLVYVCFMVSFHAVADLHDLYVFQYGSHHMLGSTCFLNGILTLVAIMLRNVYRKRHALRRGMNMDVIECVSLRCRLSYCSIQPIQPCVVPHEGSPPQEPQQPCMQTLRHVTLKLQIDPRHTVSRVLFDKFPRWKTRVLSVYGAGSMIFTILSSYEGTLLSHPTTRAAAFGACLVYCVMCFLCYQRQVLKKLLKSFDFLFFSTQLTIGHLCFADMWYWGHWTWTFAASWLGFHWALLLDAITPCNKRRLGIHPRCGALVMAIVIEMVIFSIYTMVFRYDQAGMKYRDRVLIHSSLYGAVMELRVSVVFFNCLFNGSFWALLFFWRLCFAQVETLSVLTGPVVYTNYVRVANMQRSRRWGSTVSSATGIGARHKWPPQRAKARSRAAPGRIDIPPKPE